MPEKYKRIIKIIVIVCVLVLLFDIGYLIYITYFKKTEKTYFDSINMVEITNDGYIAVGSNNNNEKSYEKAKITQYDQDKNKVWEKLYNKGYNGSFFAVKKDEDEYIAVGSYESKKQENEEGTRSAIIVKYSNEGEIIGEKRFQVLGNSKFTNVYVENDGYVVVGQSIYENMTLGLSEDGGAFIIKYDKELNEVWRSNYGGSKSGIYNDVIRVGDYYYTVGKDATRVGIISKYTLDGQRVVTTNYEYTDTLGFTSLVALNDNIYTVGSKKVTEDKNDYDTDALLVKYDLDCNYQNETTYKGKGMERFNKAIIDSNNDIVIAGQTGVYNKKKSTKDVNVFSYDGIFAKYDDNLKELELENYGNEMDDYFTDIKQDNDKYLISGYSTYDSNSYLSKFITYSKSGKLIGDN